MLTLPSYKLACTWLSVAAHRSLKYAPIDELGVGGVGFGVGAGELPALQPGALSCVRPLSSIWFSRPPASTDGLRIKLLLTAW